ncbi:MAG: Gfo/Idh/MocA family protein [Planctomycetota bacterium]
MSDNLIYRRDFLQKLGTMSLGGFVANGLSAQAVGAQKKQAPKTWKPVSKRKVRVGIVGYGVCRFGAAFGFQDHPNVEVVAVSDLIPDRRRGLMKACRCGNSYESLEMLVKDTSIEAVFVATDAPSHARHCMEVLKHDKHVMTAVPGDGSEDRLEVYDGRDEQLSGRLLCNAANLSGRRIRSACLLGGGVLSLPLEADWILQGLAHRLASSMVSHTLYGVLRWRDRQAIHLGILRRLQRGIPGLQERGQ